MSSDRSTPGSASPVSDHTAHDEALLGLLADWLPNQRWFAGSTLYRGALTLLDRLPVTATESATVEWVVVAVRTDDWATVPHDDAAATSVTYQILVGWRTEPSENIEHAIIGAVEGHMCFDALHDHQVSSLLLKAVAHGDPLGAVSGAPEPGIEVDTSASGLVLTAEQSNTSIVYGDQVILKFFRRLEPGTNPDAELLRALSAAHPPVAAGDPASGDLGGRHTPRLIGELVGPVHGAPTTLAVATEFFSNCADGWSMATASVRDLLGEADLHADEVGGDFASEAGRLGEAVAAVHRDLAEHLGTEPLGGRGAASLMEAMTGRAERFIGRVPPLEEWAPAIRRTFARLGERVTAVPATVQRIHGDLHLGQVLRTLHGWVLIDFEGEPSRPIAARRELRSPLQDVAGMLRSFDYAAQHMLVGGSSDAQLSYRASEWAQRNRAAFCDGYAAASGSDPRDWAPLLTALELDKAIYEVAYEFHHRPAWEQIPLAAVAELTSESAP